MANIRALVTDEIRGLLAFYVGEVLAAPDAPPAGQVVFYLLSGVVYYRKPNGDIVELSGGGGGGDFNDANFQVLSVDTTIPSNLGTYEIIGLDTNAVGQTLTLPDPVGVDPNKRILVIGVGNGPESWDVTCAGSLDGGDFTVVQRGIFEIVSDGSAWYVGGTNPAAGGGGANDTLSNLVDPTSINQNLIFGAPGSTKFIRTGDAATADALTIRSGHSSSGAAATVTITTGDTGTGVAGGEVRVIAGAGNGSDGGLATVKGGDGDAGNGGNGILQGGEGIGGFPGGAVILRGGASDGGSPGNIELEVGQDTTNNSQALINIPPKIEGPVAIAFRENNGEHYVGLRAPVNVAGNYTISLPGTTDAANQIMVADGSGNLNWQDQPAGTEFKRQIINFSDLASSGAAAGTTFAATYNIPDRHILESATIHVRTVFTGPQTSAVAALTSGNYGLTGLNLLLADDTKTAATNYKYVLSDTPGIQIDTVGANIGDFTDGELEIVLKLKLVDSIPATVFFNET